MRRTGLGELEEDLGSDCRVAKRTASHIVQTVVVTDFNKFSFNPNEAFFLEPGQYPAHSFRGQSQVVSYVTAGHCQIK